MPLRRHVGFLVTLGVLILMACAFAFHAATQGEARLSVAQGTGKTPSLPAPDTSLLPVVNVVTAKGWAQNERPTTADVGNVIWRVRSTTLAASLVRPTDSMNFRKPEPR
jgi:hypothetical protein